MTEHIYYMYKPTRTRYIVLLCCVFLDSSVVVSKNPKAKTEISKQYA